jgi:divalent metal cation (Fe/Co/Zn/Cd) transporter
LRAHTEVGAQTHDRGVWIRQSFQLAVAVAGFHVLQFMAGMALWFNTGSVALAAFGLDAGVSSLAAMVLALRIRRSFETLGENWRSRVAGGAYLAASVAVVVLAGVQLWWGEWPAPSILAIALAAVSMLVIPIVGSYMKTLAVELRNQPLKSAAIFTFGNSYLSMVLLVSLLLNWGMDLRWGDALGALVMFPFLAQKGFQTLIEEGKREYEED